MDKMIFLIAMFLAGAYADQGYITPVTCKPSVSLTTSLAECYSTKDIIELTFKADCFPMNLELFLFACNRNTCKKIVLVCPVEGVVQVDLSDGFTVGEKYCLRIQTYDAYYGAASGYFTVGERAISIAPLESKCISYKDIITIKYDASCFQTCTQLEVFYCCELQCTKLGFISSDDKELQVNIIYPFTIGLSYTIGIQTKDGYVVAQSEEFIVKESCVCCPTIEITSPIESCYAVEDIISISYRVSCIPFNSYLVISVCPEKSDCFSIGVTSTNVYSCTVNLLNLLRPGQRYYITLSTKNGKAIARTPTFSVDIARIVISSDLKECYNPNDILEIIYKSVCLSSKYTRLIASVCQDENCTQLGYVPADKNKFKVSLVDPFALGGPYRISIASKNGYIEGCTTDFIIGKPSIEILDCTDYCYTIGQKIVLTFVARCFSCVTKLDVLLCPQSNGICKKVAEVDSDEDRVEIEVTSSLFKDGEDYVFKIQTESGYPSTTSKKFTIQQCCGDALKITTDVKPCYVYGQLVTVEYEFYCDIDSTFTVWCCTSDIPGANCLKANASLSTKSGYFTFDTSVKPEALPPGYRYCCALEDDETGFIYAKTDFFKVTGVKCPFGNEPYPCPTRYALSEIEDCYSSDDEIALEFSYSCTVLEDDSDSNLEFVAQACKIVDEVGNGANEDLNDDYCSELNLKIKPDSGSNSYRFVVSLSSFDEDCWYYIKIMLCKNIATMTKNLLISNSCSSA